ncbi:hypothetical protein U9M48_004292 [Paspalum notatum var. saurae]|uniref:Uncharacterized protein n=1 Tax=Paspalum notatum var. saurae TaxID=547442 RepID=A0AAQ3PVA1_PASNO
MANLLSVPRATTAPAAVMLRPKLFELVFNIAHAQSLTSAPYHGGDVGRAHSKRPSRRDCGPEGVIRLLTIVQAKNLKILLCVFEQLSRLKINFHKNELYCFGKANDHVDQYSQILGCGVGKYPFKYLGIPMNFRKLNNKDRRTVEKRFQKKLSSENFYLMIPKGIRKKLDFFRSDFFWQGDNHRKKYRLTKCGLLCLPKDQRGLGILNLKAQNTCLLSKWLYKLINEDGIWQQLVRKKYLKNKSVGEFMDLFTFQVYNGLQTRFWEEQVVRELYSQKNSIHLYSILPEKNIVQLLMSLAQILLIFLLEGLWWAINLLNEMIWWRGLLLSN